MINSWEIISSAQTYTPHEAVLARMIMAKDDAENKSDKDSIKQDWEPGAEGKAVGALFTPEELDIYANKATLETFIFHGKEIDYESLDYLEYDPNDHSVDVVKKDGTRMDLGVKIQWLIRSYFTKAEEINIVRTKDGKSIDGTVVPLKHKKKKEE